MLHLFHKKSNIYIYIILYSITKMCMILICKNMFDKKFFMHYNETVKWRSTATEEKEIRFMALTRKFLSAMGIEADKIEEIITAHVEITDALKEEKGDLQKQINSLQKQVETLEPNAEKVEELEKEIKDLKDNDTSKKYEEKYKTAKDELAKVQKEFDDYKESVKNEGIKKTKTDIYRGILKKAGISEKRIDAVMKLSTDEVESLNLNDDNAISDDDKKALIEKVKEDWSDYITTVDTKGANTDKPPANDGGKNITKEEIMKIKDRNERQQAISENHELFGY